jgi:hypothetical protein
MSLIYKTGKLPAKNDPRDFLLKSYLVKSQLPPIPSAVDWTKAIKTWPMFANDRVGDCVFAGAANVIMTAHANVNRPFVPSDKQVLSAYSAVSGYDPNDSESDRGAYLSEGLNYWRKNGIATNKIGAYVKVNHRMRTNMMAALYLFGALYVGFMLPATIDHQINNGLAWDVLDPSLSGDAAPGTGGGHCVAIFRANTSSYFCASWGRLWRVTNDFIKAYMDEAYAVIHWAWIKDNGLAPSGFNMKSLMADLNKVG